jgi:hypothetical protein
MARLPLNAVVLLLLLEVVNPCFDIIRSNLYRDFCNKVADSVLILPDHLQKEMFLFLCVLSVVSFRVKCEFQLMLKSLFIGHLLKIG